MSSSSIAWKPLGSNPWVGSKLGSKPACDPWWLSTYGFSDFPLLLSKACTLLELTLVKVLFSPDWVWYLSTLRFPWTATNLPFDI